MPSKKKRNPVFPVCAFVLATASLRGGVPDDPDWTLQWGLHNSGQIVDGSAGVAGADVEALEAWAIHEGVPSVVVAIVGSGIDPHPEFADRLVEGVATVGDPFDTDDGCPQDTHLAGIIAAATNNGAGIAGLNGSARILPVRVLEDCWGTEDSAAQGIRWAVDHGAGVILVPLQFYVGGAALEDAVAYAVTHDVVIVAPAGNAGNEQVAYPAGFDGCLAVSATTAQDTFSPFSNYGAGVDLSAPGAFVWSTWIDEGYAYLEPPRDAAAAAAFVTGIASMVRSYAPQLDEAEVRQTLIASVEDLGAAGWDIRFGAGRVNARRALEAAPAPALRFEIVDPLPDLLRPDQATTVPLRIVNVAEDVVDGTAALFYSVDSVRFFRIDLTPLGGDLFEAVIPALPCGTQLEYYFIAFGDAGSVVTDPLDAPTTVHHAEVIVWRTVFSDDFEQDLGWEVSGGDNTSGRWSRVVPVGTSAQPGHDFSRGAGGLCYVTGQHFGGGAGTNDVDEGPVSLVSPLVALQTEDAEVSYARWFHSTSDPGAVDDVLVVEVSRDDGSTWFEVETVTTTHAWVPSGFRLSAIPESVGSALRVRFSTSDIPNDSLTEAAIDEFRVREVHCTFAGGDGNGDGVVDLFDFGELSGCLAGPGGGTPEDDCLAFDFEPDGDVDLGDLDAFERVFGPR
ncbi:MAG: S8 family serine peptidase [Phycisphaerae bacterium]|jgi:hypothetical protein